MTTPPPAGDPAPPTDPENPIGEAAPSSIGRRQVAALAELIELSNACEQQERALTGERDRRVAFVETRHRRNTGHAEERAAEAKREFRRWRDAQQQAFAEETAGLRARLDADAAKLGQQIQAKARDRDAGSKKEYQHERWVADSVLEGRLGELRKQREQDTARLDEWVQRATRCDERLGDTAANYRQPRPDFEPFPEEARDPGKTADPRAAADGFDELLADAPRQQAALEDALRGVRRLKLPVLYLSFLPYLLGFVLATAAAAGAVWLGVQLGWSWSPVISGFGGFAVGGLLVWFGGKLLFGVASRQVTRAVGSYRATRTHHAEFLARSYDAAQAKHDAAAAGARAERDRAHAATEAKFAPYFQKIADRLASSSGELDEKVAAKAAEIDRREAEQRDAFTAEARAREEAIGARETRRLDIARRRRERDLGAAAARFDGGQAELRRRWDAGRDRVLRSLDEVRQLEATSNRPWDDPAWGDWSPPTEPAPAVRFGELQLDTAALVDEAARAGRFDLGLPADLRVPALLSGPDGRSLYLAAPPEARDEAAGVLLSVVLRLLTTLPPGRAKFTLVDPVRLGESFSALMHLADHEDGLVNGRVWSEPAHIDRRLVDLTDHMGQMIQKYLRNDFVSIDDYNAQAGSLAEPYRFLVVADYPHGFSAEAVARLHSIAASGARCGVFVLVLHDPRQAPPGGELGDLTRHCVVVTRGADGWRWRHPVAERFALTPDAPPAEALTTRLVERVGRAAVDAGRVQVPFDTITPASAEACWSRRASETVEVAVGRAGATRLQTFRLGVGVAQHALVAGKTGSGKSSLLHTLIANLCLWYPPDQLELYLIDFKKGVEFKPYVVNRPPHLRAVAVESDREFGLSILRRLDAMLDERGELFRAAGVANLAGYHRAEPDRPMPRVLLIVDEFQELFSQDDAIAQNATLLLDRLVRQGRAFGMHAFLGSQSLSGAAGLPRGTLGQMAVRVALQCSENDSQLILGDENSAARLLSRPGEAIYNDQGGSLEANSLFQVAWLPDHELRRNLETIRGLAEDRGVGPRPCFVFEGNAAADLDDNAPLRALLDAPDWPAPAPAGGVSDPPAAYLGEPIAIDDPVAVALPRLNGANALILGQNGEATLGLLATALLGLAAAHRPDRARFVFFNGSTEPEHDALVRAALDAMPHGVAPVPFRDTDATLAELHAELKRRVEDGDHDAPAIYIAVSHLQRFRQFRAADDGFSFSLDDDADGGGGGKPDAQLLELLRDGPVVGMHLLVAADRAASVEPVFDRRALREFDHRVLFQMSATDSAQLIDSSAANDLGPYRALLYREDRGTITRFRPYGLPSEDQLARFRDKLARPMRGGTPSPP